LHLNSVQSKIRAMRPLPVANAAQGIVASSPRADWEGRVIRNRLLLSLPEADFEGLRQSLTFERLPHHAKLHEAGAELEYVYFPNRGLISLVVVTREGKTVEVAMVGHEGVVGTAALIGMKRFPFRAVVQIGGDSLRIGVEALQNAVANSTSLQAALSQYAIIQAMEAEQSAACNRLHGIEQRLTRWLLMMQDRVNYSSLLITHDFLAAMLGTDRPSVSLAASDLQRRGAIEYTRGEVRIASRSLLEEIACECYQVMQQFNRLDLLHSNG
jgi:CRP-like cAMP-binding protein